LIRHRPCFQSLEVLSLAITMVVTAFFGALVLAISLAVALGLRCIAALIAVVGLSSEVGTTHAEHFSAPLALASKKRDTTLPRHRPLGRRALDSAAELWDAQDVTV
jgi:hypothetical protein